MTKCAACLCLFVSWLVPFHFPPWVSWQNEVPSFFAVVLLAWGGIFALARNQNSAFVLLPMAALPFLAVGVIAAIQFASGLLPFGGDALVIGFYLALCVICLCLGTVCGRKVGSVPAGQESSSTGNGEISSVTLIAWALLAGAFASSILAFGQVLDLWEGAGWISRMPTLRRPGANIGQPNQLASLLLMGMVSALYLYMARKLGALACAVIFLVSAAGLAVTESRTGILSFLLIAIWILAKRRVIGPRPPSWVVVLFALGTLCLFWTWPTLNDAIQISEVGAGVDTRAGTRLIVWPQLVDAILLRPWWGWGIGRVSDALNAVAHAYPVSESFTYSHNIVLDLALGLGLPAAALLTLVSGAWLWRRVRSANQLLPWYCVAVAMPVAVHSFFEFPFAYAYFLAPVMFMLGVLDGTSRSPSAIRIGVPAAAAMLFVTSVLMVWSVIEYFRIEEDFRMVRFEALRIGTARPEYQRPKVLLLTQLDALLSAGRIMPKPEMTVDELSLARSVALRFPWPALQNRYALALALNGNPTEAVRQLRVMRALHGDKAYAQIKENWVHLAREKHPQLQDLTLP